METWLWEDEVLRAALTLQPRVGSPRGGEVEAHTGGSSSGSASQPCVVPRRCCAGGGCGWGLCTEPLEPRLLLDPRPQGCQPAVDSRLVSLCTAITPAHNASQEHPPAVLHADQGPS